MQKDQDLSLECEFCVKLDFNNLAFIDFDLLAGETFATYNGSVMEPSRAVVDWLVSQAIPYSFIFVRTISEDREAVTGQSMTKGVITFSFFLEFTNHSDMVLFKLTWS